MFKLNFKRCITVVLVLFAYQVSIAQFTITDNFRGSGSSDVKVGGSNIASQGEAYFTSGVDDPVNSGWLRITKALGNQRGYAYIDRSFPSTLGLLVDFEYKMWRNASDGTYYGADGLSFFLFDATVPFLLGGYGGSLGYAPNTGGNVSTGVSGGYIGVGLDAYGNFSNPNEGRVGGPGVVANAITIRGATTNDPATTNPYLNHIALGIQTGGLDAVRVRNEIDFNTVTSTRPADATFYRRVQLEVVPNPSGTYRIIVRWKKGINDLNFLPLMDFESNQVPPQLLKLGFAASTGGGFNYHEIRNLLITTPNNLRVTKKANKDVIRSVNVGSNENRITYYIEVVNDTDQAYTNANFLDELVDVNGNAIPTSMFTINSITPSNNFTNTNLSIVTNQNKIQGTVTIAPKTTGLITVVGTLNAIPSYNLLVNKVNVLPAGQDKDFDLANNYANVTTSVIAENVDLLLQKQTIGANCIDPTNGNTYELKVANMGAVAAQYRRTGSSNDNNKNRIVVTKVIPAGFTYSDSATPGGFTTDLNSTSNTARWTKVTQANTPSTGFTTYIYIARGDTDADKTLIGGGTALPYPIRYTITPPSGTTSYTDTSTVDYRSANGNTTYNGPGLESSYSPPNTANNSISEIIKAVPAPPTIASSTVYYCLGQVEPLSATADAGNTLVWYLNQGGVPSSIPFTPPTATRGTYKYYVSQSNGSCESSLREITVIVRNCKMLTNPILINKSRSL